MSLAHQSAFLDYFNSILSSPSKDNAITVSQTTRSPLSRFEELADPRVLSSALHAVDPETFPSAPKPKTFQPPTWTNTFTQLKKLHHLILSYPISLPLTALASRAPLGKSLSGLSHPPNTTTNTSPTKPSPLSHLPTPDLLLLSRSFPPATLAPRPPSTLASSSLGHSHTNPLASLALHQLLTLIVLLQAVYGPSNEVVIGKIRELGVGEQKGLKEVIETGLGQINAKGGDGGWEGFVDEDAEVEGGQEEEDDPEASRTYIAARERSLLIAENEALKREKTKLSQKLALKNTLSPPRSVPSLSPELQQGGPLAPTSPESSAAGAETEKEELRAGAGRGRSSRSVGEGEAERLREELDAKEDELRQTELMLEENIKTLQTATQRIVDLQKKSEKVEDLKEQLDIHKQSAEKLRRAENVNEKLRKKLDETVELRKEMKILEERNTQLTTLNSQLQQKTGSNSTQKAVLEAYRSQIGELEKVGKEKDLEAQNLQAQLEAAHQELEDLRIHASIEAEDLHQRRGSGSLLDAQRIDRRQSTLLLGPVGRGSLADELGAIGSEVEVEPPKTPGAIKADEELLKAAVEKQSAQAKEINKLQLQIIRLSASLPPDISGISVEAQRKLLEQHEKNLELAETVKDMEDKLLAAKRMLREQEAIIQNGKSSTVSGTFSAFEEAERSYKSEIDLLKSDVKRAKRTIAEMEKRYRAEKLLMLSAWNDLGQRTMKGDSQPVSWLAQQRNVSAGGPLMTFSPAILSAPATRGLAAVQGRSDFLGASNFAALKSRSCAVVSHQQRPTDLLHFLNRPHSFTMFGRQAARTLKAASSTSHAVRALPLRPSASSALASRPAISSFPRLYSSATEKAEEKLDKATEKVEEVAGELQQKLTELEGQVKELKSQLTYGKADFINLQRRSEQEKTAAREFAIQGFASDLLSTIDILSTALKYVKQPIAADNSELKSLFSGVDMTKGELLKTLAKHGVVQFDPTGEKFDPNLHEALYQAPVPGKEPGTVLECQKVGYMLKSRTLRPAQVGVVQESS